MKMPGLTGAVCIQDCNYTDCKWNKNPLELAEVDHCFTVWAFCLWGTQTDWESGHMAVWWKSLFCPIVESDVCPHVLITAKVFSWKMKIRFSVS